MTKRSLAGALLGSAAMLAMGGAAVAEPPDWALQCAATTNNPWITSGYCESHDTWDKYYCKCAFVPPGPPGPFFGLGGNRRDGDNIADDNVGDDSSPR